MPNLLHDLTGSIVAIAGVIAIVIGLAEVLAHPTSNGWVDWMNEDRWRHL